AIVASGLQIQPVGFDQAGGRRLDGVGGGQQRLVLDGGSGAGDHARSLPRLTTQHGHVFGNLISAHIHHPAAKRKWALYRCLQTLDRANLLSSLLCLRPILSKGHRALYHRPFSSVTAANWRCCCWARSSATTTRDTGCRPASSRPKPTCARKRAAMPHWA